MASLEIIVPCYNEGMNVLTIAAAVRTELPEASLVFLDDASDTVSQGFLQEACERYAATVVRESTRKGKAANLLAAFKKSLVSERIVLTADSDVVFEQGTLRALVSALEGNDLVAANPLALQPPKTLVERATIFASKLHARLRLDCEIDRPAFCVVGRLLGFSPKALKAITASTVPDHTEDAHFAFVALANKLQLAYLPEAIVRYRAPSTLVDHMRQSHRFRDGVALARRLWGDAIVESQLLPSRAHVWKALRATVVSDPVGALTYVLLSCLSALLSMLSPVSRSGTWKISESTKVLPTN